MSVTPPPPCVVVLAICVQSLKYSFFTILNRVFTSSSISSVDIPSISSIFQPYSEHYYQWVNQYNYHFPTLAAATTTPQSCPAQTSASAVTTTFSSLTLSTSLASTAAPAATHILVHYPGYHNTLVRSLYCRPRFYLCPPSYSPVQRILRVLLSFNDVYVDSSSSSSHRVTQVGVIVGAVVGGIVGITILAHLFFCIRRRFAKLHVTATLIPTVVVVLSPVSTLQTM